MTLVENSAIYRKFNSQFCPPFCKCDFPNAPTLTTYRGVIHDLVKCQCGEKSVITKVNYGSEWRWQEQSCQSTVSHSSRLRSDENRFEREENEEEGNALITNAGRDITFHPIYSQGTSIVRGNKPLAVGMIHYWEIRIITALTGTDVMFGIGTDKVQLNAYKFHFISALGRTAHSWGFSYNGRKQHGNLQERYGQPFTQGCLIGVYLDRSKGYLEFFLNRQSMGIAYHNIPLDPNINIYPMVCSTVARSCIRLVNACSVPDSLQFRAFHSLVKTKPSLISSLAKDLPGLRNVIGKYWFLSVTNAKENSSQTSHSASHPILDHQCLATLAELRAQPSPSSSLSSILSSPFVRGKNENDLTRDSEKIIRKITSGSRVRRKHKFHPTLDEIPDISDERCSSSEKLLIHKQQQQQHQLQHH